jgi:PhoH-like ATPase
MEKVIVLDTNVLIDNPDMLLDRTKRFAISYVSLAELDGLKSNPELSYPARRAIKVIYELYSQDLIQVINVPSDNKTNDEKIVEDTKLVDGQLYSQDIGALVVAKTRGVPVYSGNEISKEYDRQFKGYLEVTIPSEAYYKLTQNTYSIEHMSSIVEQDIQVNSYLVLYPSDKDASNYLVWKRYNDRYELVPPSTKHLKAAGIGIEWLHPEQLIAFDAVFNTDSPLAVITGKIGASKTLMSLCGALARTVGHKNKKSYDKIMVTRPNIPINRQFALGFLPGAVEDKMSSWLAPIKTNLQFLYETTAKDIENKEADKIYDTYFEALPIESIQGASLHNKCVLVDEAQLLDVNTLRQIMSRIATGSKLVLILDPSQTYGANRGVEGYKKLLPHCKGNEYISFVELQHIQRSELTRVVDEIFK